MLCVEEVYGWPLGGDDDETGEGWSSDETESAADCRPGCAACYKMAAAHCILGWTMWVLCCTRGDGHPYRRGGEAPHRPGLHMEPWRQVC